MPVFGRVATAMATPFADDETLDMAGIARLASHLAGTGSDTIVVNGTTGESPTLSLDEVATVVGTVRDTVGDDTRVMVGTGTNSTTASVARTAAAADMGADAVLVVSPYYNKPDHAGMMRHFTAVAAATDLPVMMYDVPSRTGREMPVSSIVELARIEHVVALKDACADLGKTGDVLAATADTPRFEVYCGADEVNLPMLAVGAAGLVSVSAHLCGDDLAAMCAAVAAGDLPTARELHLRLLPLHRALFMSPSPAPLKAGLELLGLPAGPVRGPLTAAPQPVVDAMCAALDHAGLLP